MASTGTLTVGDPVAVIEDDETNSRAIGWALEEAQYQPIWIPPDPAGIDGLLRKIRDSASAAISDHRLGKIQTIPYYGAEVVARSNQEKIPAILISSYANSDESTSIRIWRANIPRLLNRGTGVSDPDQIVAALNQAQEECRGEFAYERRPFETIVRVGDLRGGPSGAVAEVIVTAWKPRETVDIPASMIMEGLALSLRQIRGIRFAAEVNIYAENPGELYFRNLRPAPILPPEWSTV